MGLGFSAVCRVLWVFSLFFLFFLACSCLIFFFFFLYTSCMLRGALCFLYISLITYKKQEKGIQMTSSVVMKRSLVNIQFS
jgi:hypothetical protein